MIKPLMDRTKSMTASIIHHVSLRLAVEQELALATLERIIKTVKPVKAMSKLTRVDQTSLLITHTN